MGCSGSFTAGRATRRNPNEMRRAPRAGMLITFGAKIVARSSTGDHFNADISL